MVNSTYLELTNRLLRRLNEVEIQPSDFVSVRGVQATAKDAVLDTMRKINSYRSSWPFNAVEHTQVLSVGVEEYAWPLYFSTVDWKSFQIQKDDTLNIASRNLEFIHREEWYQYLRNQDHDAGVDGLGLPYYVLPTHGRGFAVSPSPSEAYTLKYRYYKNPPDLVAYDDQTTIPSQFNYVILSGSLYHMNLFKENPDGMSLMKQEFREGLADMVNVLLPNNSEYFYDTRVLKGVRR